MIQKRYLNSCGQSQSFLIYQIKYWRDQLHQAKVSMQLSSAFTNLFGKNNIGLKISPELGGIIFGRSSCFSSHRIILHLICKCFLAWKNLFSLQIGIHHGQNGFIVIIFFYDSRDLL